MNARIAGLAALGVAAFAGTLWLAKHSVLRTPAALDARELEARTSTSRTPTTVRAAADPNATPVRTEAATGDATPPLDGVPVDVFDGDGDTLIAGVQIISIEWGDESSTHHTLRHAERGALFEHVESRGLATRTDARGRALVPRAVVESTVVARLGAARALADYLPTDDRIVLRLAPARTMEVHVASESGADARDVEVVLLSQLYFGRQFRAKTDENGLARFRAVQPFDGVRRSEAVEFTTRGPFARRPRVAYDSFDEIPARVELTLPPCGRVEIELLRSDGKPVDGTAQFEIRMLHGWAFGAIDATSPDGRLRLPFVEVDAEFEVTASIAGPHGFVRQFARGPSFPGENLRLTLQLGDPAAAVYRAVDQQGHILARHALRGLVRDQSTARHDASDPHFELQMETDGEGRFRLPLPDRMGVQPGGQGHRNVDLFAAPGGDGVERHFRAELRADGPEADIEGGDAVFLPASLLVAGRVFDETGTAVAGAMVLATGRESRSDAKEPADTAFEVLGWALTDSKGRFVMLGGIDSTHLRVCAAEGERRSPHHDVEWGETDVVLTLPLRGSLVGSLLLPPGARAELVNVEWIRDDSPPNLPPDRSAGAVQAADPTVACFQLDALRVGRGDVRVLVAGREITRIEAVDVLPTQPTRDPRLQRIDLRARTRALRVHVDLHSGQVAQTGEVHVKPSLEHGEFDLGKPGFPISHGIADVLIPAGPVDVRVEVRGMRVALAHHVVANSTQVRLQPEFDLNIEFRAPSPLDDVSVYCRSQASRERVSVTLQSNATGAIANTQVGTVGPWVVWMTTRRSGAEFGLGEWTLDVADTDGLQRFVLDVDPSRLEESRR